MDPFVKKSLLFCALLMMAAFGYVAHIFEQPLSDGKQLAQVDDWKGRSHLATPDQEKLKGLEGHNPEDDSEDDPPPADVFAAKAPPEEVDVLLLPDLIRSPLQWIFGDFSPALVRGLDKLLVVTVDLLYLLFLLGPIGLPIALTWRLPELRARAAGLSVLLTMIAMAAPALQVWPFTMRPTQLLILDFALFLALLGGSIIWSAQRGSAPGFDTPLPFQDVIRWRFSLCSSFLALHLVCVWSQVHALEARGVDTASLVTAALLALSCGVPIAAAVDNKLDMPEAAMSLWPGDCGAGVEHCGAGDLIDAGCGGCGL